MLNIKLALNGNALTQTYWLQQVKYWSFFTAYWAMAWIVSWQFGRGRELLLITGAALLGTVSRLGIFSAVIGFTLWGWFYLKNDLTGTRFRHVWLGLLVSIPLLAGLWFGPERLIERLLIIDQATGRLEIWRTMLEAPASSRACLNSSAQRGLLPSMWRAHSEYLQVVFEFGVIGAALLILFFVVWAKRCRPRQLDSIQRGALAGVVTVMVHNIADFDLQVPGTALWHSIAGYFVYA